jgi:hypothetical protein
MLGAVVERDGTAAVVAAAAEGGGGNGTGIRCASATSPRDLVVLSMLMSATTRRRFSGCDRT